MKKSCCKIFGDGYAWNTDNFPPEEQAKEQADEMLAIISRDQSTKVMQHQAPRPDQDYCCFPNLRKDIFNWRHLEQVHKNDPWYGWVVIGGRSHDNEQNWNFEE